MPSTKTAKKSKPLWTAGRFMGFDEFVLCRLPSRPAHVLEIGCGRGELAFALDAAGHVVTAVDPRAPEGGIFHRATIEEFDGSKTFDAVVASGSLHHVRDLSVVLDKVSRLLRPGGVLILNEFGWDLFDEPTADWYWRRQRAIESAGGAPAPRSVEESRCRWREEHSGLHGFETMRGELDIRFAECFFARTAYLHRMLESNAGETSEQARIAEEMRIEEGAIQAIGFRYVGERQ